MNERRKLADKWFRNYPNVMTLLCISPRDNVSSVIPFLIVSGGDDVALVVTSLV